VNSWALCILIHLPAVPGRLGLMDATSNSAKLGRTAVDWASMPPAIASKTAAAVLRVSGMIHPHQDEKRYSA
jgi:hypothetical protein